MKAIEKFSLSKANAHLENEPEKIDLGESRALDVGKRISSSFGGQREEFGISKQKLYNRHCCFACSTLSGKSTPIFFRKPSLPQPSLCHVKRAN